MASLSRVCAFSRTRSLSSSAWKVSRSAVTGRLAALVALDTGPPRFADSSFITISSCCIDRAKLFVEEREGEGSPALVRRLGKLARLKPGGGAGRPSTSGWGTGDFSA
jgi:hypothetical protein